MTLYAKLQLARSEEDVKDACLKVRPRWGDMIIATLFNVSTKSRRDDIIIAQILFNPEGMI
jgi:hypothetical protein